jgi:hypothetical protein
MALLAVILTTGGRRDLILLRRFLPGIGVPDGDPSLRSG